MLIVNILTRFFGCILHY